MEHNEDGQRVVVQEQLGTNTSTLSSTGIVAGCSPGRGDMKSDVFIVEIVEIGGLHIHISGSGHGFVLSMVVS